MQTEPPKTIKSPRMLDQLPDVNEPTPRWADTSNAKAEEKNWAELDEVKKTNNVRWLKAYGWIVLAITITFTAIFLGSLVVWALHYMIPEKCTWLTDEQLSKIQSVLFSGGMGAVLSSVIKRQFDKLRI